MNGSKPNTGEGDGSQAKGAQEPQEGLEPLEVRHAALAKVASAQGRELEELSNRCDQLTTDLDKAVESLNEKDELLERYIESRDALGEQLSAFESMRGPLPLEAAALLFGECQRREGLMGAARMPSTHISPEGTHWRVESNDTHIVIEAARGAFGIEQAKNLLDRRLTDLASPYQRLAARKSSLQTIAGALKQTPEGTALHATRTAQHAAVKQELEDIQADILAREEEIKGLREKAAAGVVDRWEFPIGATVHCFLHLAEPAVIGGLAGMMEDEDDGA